MSSKLLKTPQVRITPEWKKKIQRLPVPSGIPACVIGTSVFGPAFIPLRMANIAHFTASFGFPYSGFGSQAAAGWLKGKSSCTFMRVLGSGDCNKRLSDGSVNNAGFVVGDRLADFSTSPFLRSNSYAYSKGPPGNTYFLGCFMSESQGSTIFSEAGINHAPGSGAPIIRGVLMAPSGVLLSLHSKLNSNVTPNEGGSTFAAGVFGPAPNDAGHSIGDIFTSDGESIDSNPSQPYFTMFLNGYSNANYSNQIKASFDPESGDDYFAKKLNSDPNRIEEMGHCLYTHYDIHSKYAVVKNHSAATNLGTDYGNGSHAAFLVSSSLERNQSSASSTDFLGVPNFENFQTRYSSARSPWVVSQTDYGVISNLFRVHAISDGKLPSNIKIRIHDIEPAAIAVAGDEVYDGESYGTFSLTVYSVLGNDTKSLSGPYKGLNLNPRSKDYLAKRIGDVNIYYDFDAGKDSQKIVIDGRYSPNEIGRVIRVEMAPDVDSGKIRKCLLPFGFRGLPHLVTSGSRAESHSLFAFDNLTGPHGASGLSGAILSDIVEPPIPMIENCIRDTNDPIPWGFNTKKRYDPSNPNLHVADSVEIASGSFLKYFPDFSTIGQNVWVADNWNTPDVGGSILDCDKFNNNFFSLEKVEIMTGSITVNRKNTSIPNSEKWKHALYCRNAKPSNRKLTVNPVDHEGFSPLRFLKIEDLIHIDTERYCNFEFPLFGGFNGLDIFDKNKSEINDFAIRQEIEDPNQGLRSGPTISAYTKALAIIENEPESDFTFLALPNIRHPAVTEIAVELVDDYKNMIYLMDIEKYNEDNLLISSSAELVSIVNTAEKFTSRMINSPYVATYFPDPTLRPWQTNLIRQQASTPTPHPSSAVMLSTFAINDAASAYGLPAQGSTRGHINGATGLEFILDEDDLRKLNASRINTIITADGFDGKAGNYANTQMTLEGSKKETRKISVTRILIETKRAIRTISLAFIFEQSIERTAQKYEEQLEYYLGRNPSLKRYSLDVVRRGKKAKENFKNGLLEATVIFQPKGSKEDFKQDATVENDPQ